MRGWQDDAGVCQRGCAGKVGSVLAGWIFVGTLVGCFPMGLRTTYGSLIFRCVLAHMFTSPHGDKSTSKHVYTARVNEKSVEMKRIPFGFLHESPADVAVGRRFRNHVRQVSGVTKNISRAVFNLWRSIRDNNTTD